MDPPGEMEILVLRNEQELFVTSPYLLIPGVHSVDPLSAASIAGLEAGDIIILQTKKRYLHLVTSKKSSLLHVILKYY